MIIGKSDSDTCVDAMEWNQWILFCYMLYGIPAKHSNVLSSYRTVKIIKFPKKKSSKLFITNLEMYQKRKYKRNSL